MNDDTPVLDLAAIRARFPSLRSGTAHFDGPGGTQTPDVVAQAIYDTLTGPLSNRGALTEAERNADAAVVGARAAMGDLLGADPSGIVFGRSMTALTMDFARTMAKQWGPGDEVVVTRLDHDSNVRSWVLAAEGVGATVRFADFDRETGELDPAEIARNLSPATRLVAVTAASNLIGTMPDLPAISALVHDAGARLYVDAVHYAAHAVVDVAALGADYLACSPYKFLGPHCGVIWGRPELLEELRPDKLLPSPNHVPERFELGTLPYELLAGTTAAVDFLASLACPDAAQRSRRERLVATMTALEAHEERLRSRIERELLSLPGVTIHSRAERRTPTLLVTVAGHDPRAIQAFLAERGVNAPAGTFYAYEAARHLGLPDYGALRIGLAPYVDDSDVDRLLAGIRDCLTR
ncbi:cysteine desulfurase-like protein [Nocardioides ginsengisoli]|uniref:Cysteine desulfurase-like protein n=1 Tax=Nocardioides ginsengisoli TaxID=363868 RepID=A0ABW3W5V5_9ACTN